MKPIIKYEISKDGVGLCAYTGELSWHIHSDELSELEKWILGILRELPEKHSRRKKAA